MSGLAGVLLFASLQSPTLQGTVHGTVRTEGSLESVPYATVEVAGLGRRVATDVRGYFVLSAVPAGEQVLRALAIGHTAVEVTVQIPAGGSLVQDFLLPLEPVQLAAIEIVAEAGEETLEIPGPAPVRLDAALVEITPGLAESDVFRSIQTLPSVQAASDFSSAFYVRGGSPDQNLITLDGAPLFNPYHLGGIFSAIDPDAVATIDLFPGAMPARLGDRLSSAVQIWTREGVRDRVQGQGAISLVSARAGLDGPLPGGGGSWLVTFRRTYLDLFTDAAAALGLIDQGLPYHFTDAHLKLTHDVGRLGSLSASVYVDTEELAAEELFEEQDEFEDGFDWGSRVVSLHYRQPLGSSLLLEGLGAFSSFRSEIDFFGSSELPGLPPVQTMRGRVYMRDALAGASLTWYRRDHQVRAGLQLDQYALEYDVSSARDQFFADLLPELQRAHDLTTLAGYVEDEWRWGDRLQLRAGLRALAGRSDTEILPRLGLELALSERLSLGLGGGRYAQPISSFRNEEAELAAFLAYDLLTPVDTARLSTATDVVLGGEWRSGALQLRVDAYRKWMKDLPTPPLPSDPFDAQLLVVEGLQRAEGRSTGVEVLARREFGERGGLMASYAFTVAERELEGVRYTPRFERRHVLDLLGSFPWGERGLLGARLVLASGQPFTPVVGRWVSFAAEPVSGRVQDDFFTRFLLGEHNSDRLPGYLRVDLSARRTVEKDWFGVRMTLTPFLQVINVLNSKNVLMARPTAYGELPGPQIEYTPQLPIIPTLGLEWRF